MRSREWAVSFWPVAELFVSHDASGMYHLLKHLTSVNSGSGSASFAISSGVSYLLILLGLCVRYLLSRVRSACDK